MQRKEFIDIACDFLAEGRLARSPDKTRSEEAAARMKDMRVVARLWKKERDRFEAMPSSQLPIELRELERVADSIAACAKATLFD